MFGYNSTFFFISMHCKIYLTARGLCLGTIQHFFLFPCIVRFILLLRGGVWIHFNIIFFFMHCKSLSLLLGGGIWIQSNELVPCNSRVDGEGSGWVIWTQFNSFFFFFMHCKSLSLLLGGAVWIQSNELVPCNSRFDR